MSVFADLAIDIRHLFRRNFNRLYYGQVKFLVENRKTARRELWHAWLGILFYLELCRMTIGMFCIYYQKDAWVQLDPLVRLQKNVLKVDAPMMACVSLFFVFASGINYLYYFTAGTYIWDLLYEIAVTNVDDFKANKLWTLKEKFGWKALVNWKSGKILQYQIFMKYFPNMNMQIRNQAIAMVLVGEQGLTGVIIGLAFVSSLYVSFSLNQMLLMSYTLQEMLYTCLDLLCGVYLFFQLAILCYTIVLSLFVLLSIFKQSYVDLSRILNLTLKTNKLKNKVLNFGYIRTEHGQITKYNLDFNRHLFSSIFFTTILTQTPISVFFITYIIFRPINFVYALLLLCLLGFQTYGIVLIIYITSNSSKTLHSIHKNLIPVQMQLTESHLWLKLKYSAFYEQVNSINKIAYSIGPLVAITKETAFQLLLIYLGFYIYTIGMIFNEQRSGRY